MGVTGEGAPLRRGCRRGRCDATCRGLRDEALGVSGVARVKDYCNA
jgi:hypothetical protein